MTDESQGAAQGESQQLVTQRVREVRVVESDVPVMDTAHFEHLGRIAALMADSGMMPETLTHYGPKAKREALEHPVVRARAFMIAEQADRWKLSPFAAMPCASFVHNRLMWEGKLVAAVLESNLGIRLHYDFGKWDAKTERCIVGDEGEGDMLGVRVWGILPGETEPVDVHGSVGMWKTTGDGSPWRPGAMKRQCRYRGAREFSRAHAPGIMLGVLADDEIDMLEERADEQPRRRAKADLRGKLVAPAADGEQSGFSHAHVEAQTGGSTQLVQTEEREREEEGGAGADPHEDEKGAAEAAAEALGDDDLPEGLRRQATTDAERDQRVADRPRDFPSDLEAKAQAEKAAQETAAAAAAEEEEREQPTAIEAYLANLGRHDSGLSIKTAMAGLYKTDAWNEADFAEQRRVRQATWHACAVLVASGKDKIDPGQEPWAFRCWLETSYEPNGPDADMVEGTFRTVLLRTEAFAKLSEAQRTSISDAAEGAVTTLRKKK